MNITARKFMDSLYGLPMTNLFSFPTKAAVVFALAATGHAFGYSQKARRYIAPVRVGDIGTRPRNDRLSRAVLIGDIALVRRLIHAGASPNTALDRSKDEPLSVLELASEAGDLKMVKLLLDKGADVNAPNFWGGAAIVGASVFGTAEVVALLIKHGADVNVYDDGTRTLDYAVHRVESANGPKTRERCQRIVNELKAAGAERSALLIEAEKSTKRANAHN